MSDFDTLVPSQEHSFADTRNNPFRNMTTYCIGSDSSGSVMKVEKSYTWTAALYWRRRLRHMAFPVISLSLSHYIYTYIYPLYIALGSIFVCMYVCLKPISFGMDGPI